jgi:hypothetical protein
MNAHCHFRLLASLAAVVGLSGLAHASTVNGLHTATARTAKSGEGIRIACNAVCQAEKAKREAERRIRERQLKEKAIRNGQGAGVRG